MHRLQRSPKLALNSLEMSETMLIEFYAPDYLYKVVLRSPRVALQRFPNLALNPLERSETKLIEFYTPDYL